MEVKSKIRVLVVEDSTVARMLIEEIISNDPRLEVVASVSTAEEALNILPSVKPDVISLDVRLPGMNGLEATRHIMAEQPTPIVIVSASVESNDFRISMNALRAGALAVVEKPTSVTNAEYAVIADRLCRQLVIMSDVSVIRQRGRRISSFAPAAADGVRIAPAPSPVGSYLVLGIVASTGGPNAVTTILQALGSDYPLPILLVQHITPSFLDGFVSWLRDVCPFKVKIAQHDEIVVPGSVYVPPADRHLELSGRFLRIGDGPPESGQKPSGTVLLRSMARSLGNRALGVLLTGMGEDGAEGLKAIHDGGGHTIAEDKTTAVVYGMPAVAMRLGAVREQMPLHRIAGRLLEISQSERGQL